MPLPGLWSFAQEEAVFPLTLHFLPICHWCPSSCCSGAESQRGWVYMSPKSVAGPLRGCSFFYYPNPHWFLQPEVMGTYLPGSGALDCTVWPGAGIACSQGIFPDLYPPHVNMELPLPVLSLPLPVHAVPCLLTSPPHLCISTPSPCLHPSYLFG